MIKSTIQGKEYVVEFNQDNINGKLNGEEFIMDLLPDGNVRFHLLRGNQSYRIIVEKREGTELTLRINGKKIVVSIKDKMSLLLESMGLSFSNEVKVNEIKAPMPGLVLRVLVEPGQEVKKGDSLLVLEAMKMENMIKSPTDAVVSAVKVNLGQAVEKNQVLISFA